jgi:hypothetical protein
MKIRQAVLALYADTSQSYNTRFYVRHIFVTAPKVKSLCDVTNGQTPKPPILNIKCLSGHVFEDLTSGRGKKKEINDLYASLKEGELSSGTSA